MNTPKDSRKTSYSANLSTQFDKQQPQALEVEAAILGSLMIEKEAINEVVDILKVEHFYHPKHQTIYRAILDLFIKGEPIDLYMVLERLRKSTDFGFVEEKETAYFLAQLTNRVYSSTNIQPYAYIVLEKAIKRKLIEISNKLNQDSFEEKTELSDLLDRTQQDLFEISEVFIKKKSSDMRSLLGKAIEEITERRNHTDGLTGVASGFSALDRVTSGWQKSDLIILAARPGMGKTSFVLSAVRNAAVSFEKPAVIFSLEMSSIQLVNRLISIETSIESEKIKNGRMSEQEYMQIIHRTNALATAKLFIDDTPAISILEMRAKCRRLKTQHDIQLIVIDYLQLMSGDSGKGGNREQEIASISRNLKQLAKELDVPVIALSQLSRAVETRGGDKKPMLSDLRESGSIEQDADQVIFLYRPEYYGLTQDSEGMPTANLAEVIIAKNRHGAAETVPLRFDGKYTRFSDWNEGNPNYTNNWSGNMDIPAEMGGMNPNFNSMNDFASYDTAPSSPAITLGSKVNQQDDLHNNTNNENYWAGLDINPNEPPF